MLRAIAITLGALLSASKLDVDRSDDDRAFFAAEHKALQSKFDDLLAADQALTKHILLTGMYLQASVVIGDAVLDRGVRSAKSRVRLELKNSAMPEGADHAFPSDITDITDAERRVEPNLVLQVAAKFSQIPDFNGKDALKADIEGRANQQTKNFSERDAAEVVESGLSGTLDRAVAAGSDALYRLEKRLLDRFPREKVYVRAFFLDVTPPRKKSPAAPPTAPPAAPPAPHTGA